LKTDFSVPKHTTRPSKRESQMNVSVLHFVVQQRY
jgi:hypothetical protein